MKTLFCIVILIFSIGCAALGKKEALPEQVYMLTEESRKGCAFKKGSTIPHTIPTEINGGLNAQDCDFYDYSIDNFMSQVYWDGAPEVLDWMSVYGVFGNDGNVLKSPAEWGSVPEQALALCGDMGTATPPPVITALINQAGDPRPLLDQKENYTFYDVRMNRTLYDFFIDCDFTDANKCANPAMKPHRLPPGSVEVKIAWKIIEESQKDNFISTPGWVQDPASGQCYTELLGMVGYHTSMATDHHPEMTWASFQHKDNAPDCDNGLDDKHWNYFNKDSTQANNAYVEGKPTNVCNVLPYQGANTDNALMIAQLNRGYSKFFKDFLPWSNYEFIGAIWMDEGVMPALTKLQRGEIKLANPVLETYYQDTLNCFSCHTYQAPQDAMQVTHIGSVLKNKSGK